MRVIKIVTWEPQSAHHKSTSLYSITANKPENKQQGKLKTGHLSPDSSKPERIVEITMI